MEKIVVLQVFILNLILQQSVSSLLVDETFHSDVDLLSENSMSAAINAVIHESFFGVDMKTINIVSSVEFSQNSIVDAMVKKIIKNLSGEVSYRIDNLADIANDELLRFYNVIFVRDYDSFSSFPARIRQDDFHYDGYYLLVMVEKCENQYEDMQMMFNDVWQQFAVNLNILVHGNSPGEIEMFTYSPYTRHHCDVVVPELINKFQGFAFSTNRFYENKMENLFGCPLRIVTFNIAPLMIVGSANLEGIEGKLLTGGNFNYNYFKFEYLLMIFLFHFRTFTSA